MTDYTNLNEKMNELVIYRNLLTDRLVQKFIRLLDYPNDHSLRYAYEADLISQAETLGLKGDLFKSYLTCLLARDENIFSMIAEKTAGQPGASLLQAVNHDMSILQALFNSSPAISDSLTADYTPSLIGEAPELSVLGRRLGTLSPAAAPAALTEIFLDYYATYGYGELAHFKAFRWQDDGGLAGIANFDTIALADIIGYERQKSTLAANTEAFINGKPANNVLLIGARGTGKSSSVKALANTYFKQGLRLLEVSKQQLVHLPKMMDMLRSRPGKKFIIYLDDLSFEEFEVEYKFLKSVIEGGVETKPDNVLIYATSNRRHIIKETWSDRSGASDEIHRFDSVHEKISLSDRFGITITYSAPSQEEYLHIVEELARQNSIDLPPEQLKQEALRWELAHSGRSGRTARQFIHYIMGQ